MRRIFTLGALLLTMLVPQKARANMGLHAAAHFGVGAMGNDESLTNPKRSMGLFELQAMPGWRFPASKFMAGLLINYAFLTQLEEGKIGNGADFAGQSLHLGIGGTFETGKLKLLAAYDPIARNFSSSPLATYKGSGFHFLAGIEFEPRWFVDLEFSTTSYNEAGISGLDQHLSQPLKHWNVGLGMSYNL